MDLEAELKQLNETVDKALADRKQWMDDHMKDFAKYQVGEKLYDMNTGKLLGTITKLYRYWANHDPMLDRSMHIDYIYQTSPNMNDNTSRHGGGLWYGNKEELEKHFAWKLRCLEKAE